MASETDSRYYTADEQEYFKTHSTNWFDLAWKNPFTTAAQPKCQQG